MDNRLRVGRDILGRLFNRFNLSTGSGPFQLRTELTPITDIDKLYERNLVVTKSGLNISAAAGNSVIWTVPAGTEWEVRLLWRQTTTGATCFKIFPVGTADYGIKSQAATTGEQLLICNIILPEGTTIALANTNNGADIDKQAGIIYIERDVR